MMGSRGGSPFLRGDLGTAMRMAVVVLQCNSLTPFRVEKDACSSNINRKRFGCMLFLFVQCSTEEFGFYLRKKELITITKEVWQGTPLVWWSLPRRMI